MTASVLFMSYDGMLEPLGQSQVLGYLERLSGAHRVFLISYEKAEDLAAADALADMRRRLRSAGIRWVPLRYHKRPTVPATAFDIAMGIIVSLWLMVRHRLSVFHARSYVPGAVGLIVKRLLGRKLLFDIRGFWADERIDAGIWPSDSRVYRSAKTLERKIFLASDEIVTLTHASEAEIRQFPYLKGRAPPITVIPTCADLERFRRVPPEGAAPFTFGFVGAATTWSLLDDILRCFAAIRRRVPDARLLIVNRGEHEFIRGRLANSGVDPDAVELTAAEHAAMPRLISRMDAAAAIRKQAYSQIACAPTKLAEYLGCGVPCLVNEGVGDVVQIVEENRVGVVLRDFSDAGVDSAMGELIDRAREPGIRERCAATAAKLFAVEDGAAAFGEIYARLGAGAAAAKPELGDWRSA